VRLHDGRIAEDVRQAPAPVRSLSPLRRGRDADLESSP
jgi:hypothetical protein